MTSKTRFVALLCALLVAALTVTACGSSSNDSSGDSGSETTSASGGSGSLGPADGEIVMLSGPGGDAFFTAMKMGADEAAEQFGVDFQYISPKNLDNFVPDYTELFQQVLASKPAAIAVGNFVPSAFDPYIKKATSQGIPVVVLNAGLDTVESDGALTFLGEEPVAGGGAGGAAMAKAGVRSLLCVNGAPVNPAVNERCRGAMEQVEKAGGEAAELKIPVSESSNPARVTQMVQGYLSSHADVDGVYTTGVVLIPPTLNAVEKAGRKGEVKIGTADLSTVVLKAVQSGDLLFAVDQQPWLQGYLGVQTLYHYLQTGLHPTAPVLTGGLVVDKGNVDQVLEVQGKYDGLRGAQ